MALQAKYKEYLTNPSAEALAADVSLNYVPTTTALREPATVLRHLKAQSELVEKKSEKFLNVVEGVNSICVETETTLYFSQGGGTYLPGLDDNFLGGKTIVLPITHIVTFNEENQIQQIRLLWDQGCLLKAVDTIGARGRNWPIRDGKEQIKMIASLTAVAPAAPASEERLGRPQARGTDPHSSLSLFSNRVAHHREDSQPNVVAPRQSAKPPPREYGELFAGGESPAAAERTPSPTKRDPENTNALKGGAGQNYHASRLFTHEEASPYDNREAGIKTDATKYDHFEFGHDEPEFKVPFTPADKAKDKHQSQWDFADFTTPIKPPARKQYPNQISTLAWQADLDAEEPKPNVFLPHVAHARPDANPHFSFDNVETPAAERHSRPITSSSTASALYADNVHGGDDGSYGGKIAPERPSTTSQAPATEQEKMPLRDITNPNAHAKTFGSHWEMNDANFELQNENSRNGKGGAKGKVNKAMDRAWNLYEHSPDKGDDEEPRRGITIAGDGMGKRKTGEPNWWDEGW